MKYFPVFIIMLFFISAAYSFAQVNSKNNKRDDRAVEYISPVRILWQSDNNNEFIKGAQNLLKKGNQQADLSGSNLCYIKNDKNTKSSLLLDFGKELQGGILIITDQKTTKAARIRIRFGESAEEAMAELGRKKNATNDHSLRDLETGVPWLGSLEIGNTGFRFVRIDLLTPESELSLKEVSAKFVFRDIPYLGSFNCNDEKINKIWQTGAYTVHLNMQQYLWDGIKRDRLVWAGDLNPEIMTINSVFGYNEVVPKSLDLCRDITPLPKWMNGISSYSLWWIINHYNWFCYTGDIKYLNEQKEYLVKLVDQIVSKIDEDNNEVLDGGRFLDWPSNDDKKAIHAGLQSLMVIALNAANEICNYIGIPETGKKCAGAADRLKKNIPPHNNSKQAASLMAIAGLMDAGKANKEVIAEGGSKKFSTFYGYYMLEAKAIAGDFEGALDNIREYWGAMLDFGATTFWEDFDLDWIKNASRIDELVPEGKDDLHGGFGAYCYIGFRHSLCHGWASGPTAWLSRYVLGIVPVEPGFKKVKITPHLGGLNFAEGSFPTPYGVIKVKHVKQPDGTVKSDIILPDGVVRAD